jgi:hypothetical protein
MKSFISKSISFIFQCIVKIFGKKFNRSDIAWLDGMQGTKVLSEYFYKDFADKNNIRCVQPQNAYGLVDDFNALNSVEFDAVKVQPQIIDFYEKTSNYQFDIWMQWKGMFQYFSKLVIRLVSRNINQLNMPLNNMEISQGMSSEIIKMYDENNHYLYACWLRKIMPANKVIYQGFYGTTKIPGKEDVFIKTIFPLPKGWVCVLLKPIVHKDGSLELASKGKHFGDSGYYRIHQLNDDQIKVVYVPIQESLHLYKAKDGIRCDHKFYFLNQSLLNLHFKITEKHQVFSAASFSLTA